MSLPTPAPGPAPCAPLAPSAPRGTPLVEAPCPFSLVFPEPGTCEPALGCSTVVAFFGQPASNAAAAHRQAIDSIFFIEFPPWAGHAQLTIMNLAERHIDSEGPPRGLLHLALARYQSLLHVAVRTHEREHA